MTPIQQSPGVCAGQPERASTGFMVASDSLFSAVKCGAETQDYVNDSPIRIFCDREPQASPPELGKLDEVKVKWKAAQEQFEIAHDVYADLAADHPDGSPALKNANKLLAEAWAEYRNALREFLNKNGWGS